MKKTLREVARIIRCKNAGPFELTMDIIFNDPTTYQMVRGSGELTKERVAELYHITVDKVLAFVWYEAALALKITIVRPIDSGSIGERDTYGAQQHAPLLLLDFSI